MKLTILPQGESIEVAEGENLLQALTDKGFYIKSSCGGNASCSDCVIKVVSGEDNLESPTFDEIKFLGNVFHITKERISCQTKLCGDVTIDISAHDKDRDQEKLNQKTNQKYSKQVRVRKKSDLPTEEEKRASFEEKPPREAGLKRPKPFNYSNEDDSEGSED